MKKTTIIYLTITTIVVASMMIVGCSLGAGSGYLQVITPDFSEINRGVYNTENSFIKEASSDGRLRYEVGVEVFGQRIISAQLKPGEDRLLTVPAGVPLTIGVGIYLAESATEEKETINAYLVSDVKSNLVLVPGETRYLDYVLDTNRPTIVDSFFEPHVANAPGLAAIVSGVLNTEDGSPYFSVIDYTDGIVKTLKFDHTSDEFEVKTNTQLSPDLGLVPQGVIYKVPDPDGCNYWHLSATGIKRGTSVSGGTFDQALPDDYTSPVKSKIPEIRNAEFVKYEDRYIYFFSYKTGYVSVRYDGSTGGLWSKVEAIDFDTYFNTLPDETFILDVEQDTTSTVPEVANNDNMVFFATQMGLFYTPELILHQINNTVTPTASQKRNKLLNNSSLIRIPNPKQPSQTLIITSVKATPNRVFFGTRAGVFMVNKNSEFWITFANSASNTFGFLNPRALTLLPAFPTEPIISNELYTINGNSLLVTATHRKVIFTRFMDSSNYAPEVRTITVWDGIPFLPKVDLPVIPGLELSDIDFLSHDVSRLSFVLFDQSQGPGNGLFWIGTYHGLGSVPLSRIFAD